MHFVAFLGINQFRRVGLRFVCWFYVGNTQRLTKGGFDVLAVVRPTRVYLLDFFCSCIQFYVLLIVLIFALSPFYILIYMFYEMMHG